MEHSIIFIHIPKTAGVSIGNSLGNTRLLKPTTAFRHELARSIINEITPGCIVLGVVRNPYDRLYSIYEFYRKKRNDININVTFEEFIINFEKDYYSKLPQFYSCYDYLTDEFGKLLTTDIIKFENLTIEYDIFCKKYNITNTLTISNENELKDNNVDWNTLYNEEMIKVVEKVFHKDLEMFNYSYYDFIKSKR